MDGRFDRVYLFKDELNKVKQLCEDYHINDNGIFEHAANFHISWGIGPEGLIYISPTSFLSHKPDFNNVEEVMDFLDNFNNFN